MFSVNGFTRTALKSLALVSLAAAAFAAQPIVKTVPWVAADPSVPHDTYAFKAVTLKGTSSLQGTNIRATWDFGDGSPTASSTVTDAYNVSATHTYSGVTGTVYSARLTVTDLSTGEYSFADYPVAVREQTLDVQVNVAIDEGLWYLHRSMNRTPTTGDWLGTACYACDPTGEATAWNVLAFEKQGHTDVGDSADPYTETVARAHAAVLMQVTTQQPKGAVFARAAHVNAQADAQGSAPSLTDATAVAAADAGTLVVRQSTEGYWLGSNPASTASFETAQALFALTATPVHLAGVNSVTNVSTQVEVTNTGFTYNRATGAYSGTLTVKNISASTIPGPITVGITGLAPGVTLVNSNGTFNGAPYRSITPNPMLPGASVSVAIVFVGGGVSFNRFTYSGTFPPAALTLACPAGTATMGTPYSSSFDANGGVLAYSFAITTGTLPAGLNINATTGAITGTPTTSGNVSFSGTVTDAAGPTGQTATQPCSINVANPAPPDLTISKSHTGSFTQGSTGNTYTVIVTNSGGGDKTAGQSVSVTDAPPSGLSVTAMGGSGWTCTTLPTCTRNDVLAASSSYPPITVTVTVAANASSPQVNSVSVTTAQTEGNSANNTATDSTVIVQPDLTITKNHTGSFVAGSTGNTYTVTVTNSGAGDKLGGQSVSVTDAPPSGLTVTAMVGGGWTCATLPTCTRTDALASAASYPAITVTVSVTVSATSPQVNSISVTTAQNESNSGNNTATDSTVITPAPQPDLTITKNHTGNFTQGSTGNTYTVVVTNSGTGDKNAGQSVSVTDAPPSGLTVTAMGGGGWTCTTLPTCTRSDVLVSAASYPAITVTVSVTPTASSPQVNSITVTTAQTESNSGNNTATDSTAIVQPDLTISKSHTGDFTQGSTGNTYTVTVTNSGAGDKLAGQSVSVTDAPPSGLTVTAMSGGGWTCTTLPTCTRNDVLASAASYPAISVTVSVASNATSPKVNSITVTTAQNESNAGNNTATDSTVIVAPPQITSANSVTFAPGKTGQSFTVQTTGQPTGASMVIAQTGSLPTGVIFTNNNDGTATINGTPAAGTQGVSGVPPSQNYPLTINANNGIPPPASQAFTLTIACPVVTVTGAATINIIFGVAMTTSDFDQTGGNGTIAWTATGLPTNLSIDGGTGIISGTPNVTGTFSVVVKATDAGGCIGTKAVTLSVGPNLASQSFTGVGNTQFFTTGVAGAPITPAVTTANTLLVGATPAGNVLVTGATCSVGGTLTSVDGGGHFIFTPNVSAASATCTYTASSNTGPGSTGAASTTASLTFTLNNKVWYVDNATASGTNDGRSNTPVKTMNVLTTAAGDFIYVAKGTGSTTGAYTLLANQTLIGAAATLNVPTVSPILTVAGVAGNEPTLSGMLSASGATGLTVNGIIMNTSGTTAVNFVNSDGAFTFKSVSVSGATKGIVWNNTSATAGSFTITGTGTTDGSGGVITDPGAVMTRGIEFVNAHNVSLSNMTLTNANRVQGAVSDGTFGGNENTDENGAIHLQSTVNVTLNNVDINGAVQHGINGNLVTNFDLSNSIIQNTGNAVWESGIYIFNLRGTSAAGNDSTISNTTIQHTGQFNLYVQNNGSTNAAGSPANYAAVVRTAMDQLTLSNDQFLDSGVSLFGDNVTIFNTDNGANKANFRTVVTGSTFTGTVGGAFGTSDNIQVDASGTAHSDFDITTSTFSGGGQTALNVSGAGTAFATFDVHDNPTISTRTGPAINVAINGDSTMRGFIRNNPSVFTTVANSAGSGVNVVVDQTGLAVVDINNNVFKANPANATHLFGNAVIRGGARNGVAGQADLTIQNNTVTGAKFEGLELFAGNGSVGESSTVRVHFLTNAINAAAGFDDYLLDQYTGDTFQIQGLTPASGATQAQTEAFVKATDNNPGTTQVNAFGGAIVAFTAGTPALP